MKLISKKIIKFSKPIEVYDITNLSNPENANFCIANGLVIHNCVNVFKTTEQRALESEEIINILSVIGYDPNAENPMSKIQVNKVICLADKDPDGDQINVLLLSIFYKFLPQMFEKGMIYVADMPEYYAEYKNTIFVGKTLEELSENLEKANAPKTIEKNHIKGWGEIDNSLIKVLAVDEKTRKLIRIKPITDHDRMTFVRIMNDDVEYRRKMLGLADNV